VANSLKPKIDLAQPDDAVELAALHKKTWLATYPNESYGIYREDIEEAVSDWDSSEKIERRREIIAQELLDDSVLHLVAKVGSKIAGHGKVEKCQDGPNRFRSIYILPDYHATGIARALADKMLDWLGQGKDVIVDVAAYNQKAIRFYEKLGFKFDSNVGREHGSIAATLPGGKIIPEITMVKPKNSAAQG
jgi:GNAT superfamily N-acetyltransferase